MGHERRRHVRVRPSPDLDLRVDIVTSDLPMPLDIVDVSLGGLGLYVVGALADVSVGNTITLRLVFPQGFTAEAQATLRHMGKGPHALCGVEFGPLDDACRSSLNRYVSELLARGCRA